MNTLWGLQFAGWLPPIFVVGIGYPINDEAESFPLRSRDLTPSVDDYVAQQSGWPSGGADRFQRFIKDELKPWLGTNFGVDPDDNLYFGDSYGGLFGAHVLLSAPETFKRYGLGSSSFWYNHGEIFESEARYAQTNRDLSAKVFCSAPTRVQRAINSFSRGFRRTNGPRLKKRPRVNSPTTARPTWSPTRNGSSLHCEAATIQVSLSTQKSCPESST